MKYLKVQICNTLWQFAIVTLMVTGPFLVGQGLPTETSVLFAGSGVCASCHEPGGPNPGALLGPDGEDVSPTTQWRSTMMANAARDPLWRAKVSAEISGFPALQQIIEDKCTTCHTPMPRTEAHYLGNEYYSIDGIEEDPLAMDGVSCTLCHQIMADNMGLDESFSGHYQINEDHIIYGPYTNPVANPMINQSGYTPVYSEHIESSELCATCHTLFTPYVDSSGTILGEAPEQTPYLEWLNSSFPADGVGCQTCHMPYLFDPIVISNRPNSLGSRTPYAQHYFVGGNIFMLKLLKQFGGELGVTASEANFDSTIALTYRLLQNETAEITLDPSWYSSQTLQVGVRVQNNTGHKFPTAYPSRRAWIKLMVTTDTDTVFTSGDWDPQTGQINGLDTPYEPHHNIIDSPDQVQIYQPIPQNVYGDPTFTLLMISGYAKDNRIPPIGFTTDGPHYDSTAVAGNALSDPDFNRDESGAEGSGSDIITYRIGSLDPLQQYYITAELLYQSVSPEYLADLEQYDTPEVNAFFGYYNQVTNAPVVIDETSSLAPMGDVCLPGDLNDDNLLDVLDIVLLVNCILEGESCSCGDLNEDGVNDVLDVVGLVGLIIG
ncbi:MAG: hypothetical protein GXO91_09280 [FCB group bacterium]|nr:hypothetical protein [FCB group bacterium]